MRNWNERRRTIVAICEDLRQDSLHTPHGLDPVNYEPEELYEIVIDCAGYTFLTDLEERLAVVAFDLGVAAAKRSVWYK